MKIFKSKVISQKAGQKVASGRWSVVGALLFLTLCLCASVVNIQAQTTEFTYQGRLLDNALPPTANYDFEFSLWDSLVAGTQAGSTRTKAGVAVANGIFTVRLDFGNEFPGSARFLQIAMRPTGGGPYTTLAPRQPITNVPYAVKSISADVAAVADTATTANNAQNLGGVAANQYVVTADPRMTDARPPTAGSPSYIQNTTSQQAASNFNVSGNGTAGGTLSGQFVGASFGYDLLFQPFLRAVSSNSSFGFETGSANSGLANTYSGYRAGNAATSNVSNNSFFGANAGRSNSNGLNNSFFGAGSGEVNSFGGFNAFFGNNSGAANTIGNRNVFVGVTAGRDNIDGSDNVFVGGGTGQINGSGGNNSFFGSVAGTGNTTGSNNSFFGRGSGNVNVTGTFNTAIGSGANVGAGDLTFATAIGAGATVSTSNTIALGRSAGQDTVVVPGSLNVTGTINGTATNATNATNAIQAGFASSAGFANTAGNAQSADALTSVCNQCVTNGQIQSLAGSKITGPIPGVLAWSVVSGPTQQASPNSGYVVTNAGQSVITLPQSPNIGDVVRISGNGAGGWRIAQNAGQSVIGTNIGFTNQNWIPRNVSGTTIASSSDGTKLVVASRGGFLFNSTDSGATWTSRLNDSGRAWQSVASSADGSKLVAVVDGGQIYTSTDSGASWTPRESNRSWYGVASSADGSKLVAVVQGGQIYTSTDSGVTWIPRENNRTWRAVTSSADGTKLVAVGAPTNAWTSNDSGMTWTPQGNPRFWETVASSADGTKLVAAGFNGQIFTSQDSGLSWTPRETNRQWNSVASSTDGTRLIAAAGPGRIYTSVDSGVTWTPNEFSRTWTSVASSADGTKLVAAAFGGPIFTFDTLALPTPPTTTIGTAGFLIGGQYTAIELQYIGNGQFLPISHSGTFSGF